MGTPVQSGFQRVKALRGFFAVRQGMFGVVNPGDVVDIVVADAKMLRAADKVEFLTADSEIKVQTNYIPERKKAKDYGLSPEARQLALLAEAVNGLQQIVAQQSEILKQLVPKTAKGG